MEHMNVPFLYRKLLQYNKIHYDTATERFFTVTVNVETSLLPILIDIIAEPAATAVIVEPETVAMDVLPLVIVSVLPLVKPEGKDTVFLSPGFNVILLTDTFLTVTVIDLVIPPEFAVQSDVNFIIAVSSEVGFEPMDTILTVPALGILALTYVVLPLHETFLE